MVMVVGDHRWYRQRRVHDPHPRRPPQGEQYAPAKLVAANSAELAYRRVHDYRTQCNDDPGGRMHQPAQVAPFLGPGRPF